MKINDFIREVLLVLSEKEKKKLLFLVFLMLLGSLLEVVGVALIVPLVSVLVNFEKFLSIEVVSALYRMIGEPDRNTVFIISLALVIFVYLIKNIFLFYLSYKVNTFTFGVRADLSKRLFRIYLNLPWRYHVERNSSQYLNMLSNEVNYFTASVLLPFMTILSEMVVVFLVVVLLFLYVPDGTVLVISIMSVSLLTLSYSLKKKLFGLGRSRYEHEGSRIKLVQQGLNGIKEIKILGVENYVLNEYYLHSVGSANAVSSMTTLYQLPRFVMEMSLVLSVSFLVYYLVFTGKTSVEMITILSLFAAGGLRLMPSCIKLGAMWQTLRGASPSLYNVLKDLALSSVVEEEKCIGNSEIIFNKSVKFNSVGFSYDLNEPPIFSGINIVIRKNSCIGIVGQSGCGKTTFLDLILGLHIPTNGSIEVDGTNIIGNVRSWRKNVGYVPQLIHLDDDTLKKNIAFGLNESEIDMEALEQAIKCAHLTDFVKSLPNGVNEIVGEKGLKISGGQKQRVGIARAIYNNPSILIFDEATSALDSIIEKEIMNAIAEMKGSRTIIIVAHRTSTLQFCDEIFRFEKGENPEVIAFSDI